LLVDIPDEPEAEESAEAPAENPLLA